MGPSNKPKNRHSDRVATSSAAAREPPPAGNSVRPTAARPRDASSEAGKSPSGKPRRPPVENVLRPTMRRRHGRPGQAEAHATAAAAPGSGSASDRSRSQKATASAPGASPAAAPVPDEIRQRFVQVGRKYYFPDGARAFTDRGSRLTTPSENTEVIASLVAIARSRGWSDITVSGTERFRKEAWSAAKLVGLAVRGYRPSAFEQERLARTVARRDGHLPRSTDALDEERGIREREPARDPPREGLLLGRLVDHGRASYRHDPHEPMSYFATLETARGERTVWGVDLERAFKESLTAPQIGEGVGLRPVRKDVVTVKAPERDADGRLIGERDIKTHRNRWVVEKREFFEARSAAADTVRNPSIAPREAVRTHPELAGTYLYLRGAEEIARRRIRDPEDQRRFVETVRGALADSVARGEPLAAVRLRERAPAAASAERHERSSERERPAVRG